MLCPEGETTAVLSVRMKCQNGKLHIAQGLVVYVFISANYFSYACAMLLSLGFFVFFCQRILGDFYRLNVPVLSLLSLFACDVIVHLLWCM